MIKTNDGGLTWNSTSNIHTPVYSIYFLDSLYGWTVGYVGTTLDDMGAVWRTTNGGANWYKSEFQWSYRFYDLHFLDSLKGWVFGRIFNTSGHREGIIAHSTDGGQSLVFERSSSGNALLAASIVGESKIWVVGENGTILKNDYASVPVQLINFTGSVQDNGVSLCWSTATEKNNFGFEIERLKQQDGSNWITIGFVKGSGTSTQTNEYSFTDNVPETGDYVYRLKQVDLNGNFNYSFEIPISVNSYSYLLSQNYPNPFNPSTIISYSIPEFSKIQIKVFDILGEEIATLVNGEKPAGNYELNWTAGNLPSGVYFYRLQAGPFIVSKKMLLLR